MYSIARQKVDYPLYICIRDDHSDIDPEPVIREYFPNAIYERNEKQEGFDVVFGDSLKLVPEDTDVVILQSADVVHAEEYLINVLIDNVEPQVFTTVTVANADVPQDMYKNFEKGVEKVFKDWLVEGRFTRAGVGRRWYFFLGAMYKKDLESFGLFGKPLCDVVLSDTMMERGIRPKFLVDLHGIHCNHPPTWIPCKNLHTCKKRCKLKKYFLGVWE
mgnify:CR=1 FL=1